MKKLISALFGLLISLPAFARGWLPDGYTELSYIESTGTQYIDTGYTFSDGNKLVLDVNPYQEGSTFFGANSSGKEFLLGRGSIYFGGNILTDTNQFVQNKRYNIIADMNGASSSLVVDGNILFSGNASFNSKKIFLGGIEAFSADSTVTRFVALKIYGFKVYQNNTLVQNLIPAKNPSGVVGMYDTVSGTFFTNQGTGTFTAGPTLNPCRNLLDFNAFSNFNNWSATLANSGGMPSDENNRMFVLPNLTAGQTYTISFALKDSSHFPTYLYLGYVQNGAGTRIAYLTTNSVENQSYTFTAESGKTYVLRMGRTEDAENLTSSVNTIDYIQLEKGTTATNYVPYSSQCHPTSCKNLWNPSWTQSGDYVSVTNGVVSNKRVVGSATLYIMDKTGQSANITAALPAPGTRLTKTFSVSSDRQYYIKINGSQSDMPLMDNQTLEAGTYTLSFDVLSLDPSTAGGVQLTNFQLERGSTATEYVPYNAACNGCDGGLVTYQSATGTVSQNGTPTPTNPIYPTFYKQGNMILRKVGDIADTYDASTGKITRRVGVKVFDGTEQIQFNSLISGGTLFTMPFVLPANAACINSHGSGVVSITEYDTFNIYAGTDNRFFISVKNGQCDLDTTESASEQATAIKQWLAQQAANGTPVTVWYVLQTPVEETVGTTYCDLGIKVATKKYSDSKFSPVMTALNSAISTIKTVVTNTINQAAAVESLQNGKQTMPNASATNGTCPNYKQCLLVETSDGKPQWFVITDPFRDFVTPILATNTNGTTSTNDPGYQQVEYIESDGTQYIDTGVMVNAMTSHYETKIRPSNISDLQGVFGTRNSDVTTAANVFIENNGLRLDWMSGDSSYRVPIQLDTDYTIEITSGRATVNGTSYTISNIRNINENNSFMIANFNNHGSPYNTGFKGRTYYAKIYNNGSLVFDGVPVRRLSDSALGMYDTVTKTFFPNAGDGVFTAGPDVTNDADVPSGPTWSVTWSNNGDNVAGTVRGEGVCNAVAGTTYGVTATSANLSASGWRQSGASCWCKTTGVTIGQESTPVSSAPWVFVRTFSSAAYCANLCADSCAAYVRAYAEFRSAIFNTGS